jgi:hypothetical protein
LLPEEFAATRKIRASEAQATGDRNLAGAIRQLRRPTASAWLANLLVRERPAEITTLLELGSAMHKAQADLAGAEMRRLSHQRQDIVVSLSDSARQLARELGKEASEPTIKELEETLDAAIANSEAAEALASGHLATALRYSGLGGISLGGVVNTTRGTARPKGAKGQPQLQPRGKVAHEDASHSDAAVARAERQAAEDSRRRQIALDELDRCNLAIMETENRLRSLRNERTRAQVALRKAERALRASQDRAQRARIG